MDCGLTGLELRAFCLIPTNAGNEVQQAGPHKSVALIPITVSELAARLEVSIGLASTTARKLARKGMVWVMDDGRRKRLSRATTPASLALTELMAANPHVDFTSFLANSALRVLSGFTIGSTSIRLCAKSTFTPEITARRVVARLMELAVMQKSGRGLYEIRLPLLKKFVEDWVLQELEVKRRAEVPGSLIARGPHGLLRSDKHGVPTWMVPTGLSSFHNYGVKLTLALNDYYFHAFNNGQVKLGLEEHAVHALLRATIIPSGRELSYSLLVIYKNRRKLNQELFMEYAKILGSSAAAGQSLCLVDAFIAGEKWQALLKDFEIKSGPVWPSWEAFNELVKQYE